MAKRVWIVVALAGVVAVALFHELAPGRDRTGSVDKRVSGAGVPNQADAVPAPRGVPVRATMDEPLPALDTPLRLVVDDLKQRAGAGDAKAACRLAAEWSYCDTLRRAHARNEHEYREQLGQIARFGTQQGGDVNPRLLEAQQASASHFQDMIAKLDQELQHCEGTAPSMPRVRARYWRQAALGGHLPAMRHYAVGNGFRRDELLQVLPEVEIYRREAESIALQAVERGDIQTAMALAAAYSPALPRNGTFLSQIVKPDAEKAMVLLLRLDETLDRITLPGGGHLRDTPLAQRILDLESDMPLEALERARAHAALAGPLVGATARDLHAMNFSGFVTEIDRSQCEPGDATP